MNINEQERQALILLQRSLVTIRNLAMKKNLTSDEAKLIEDIADACHNVPYCFLDSNGTTLKLEQEIALMQFSLLPDESKKSERK